MTRIPPLLAIIYTLLLGTNAGPSCESTTGQTQMVTYVKRHPDWTRADFWEYWETQHAPKVVPLATYFNITRYQQVKVGGKIPPTASGADAPEESSDLVEFDGIAFFLYSSQDDLTAMLSHPYYIDVVEPDEGKFIDKEAFGGGMVATYVGEHVDAVSAGKDAWVGDEEVRGKYEDLFSSYL